MNVKPMNYAWREFYDHVIDLTKYTFSWKAIARRFGATSESIPKWMNVVRAISSEGFGRIRYHSRVRRLLDEDDSFLPYFEGESDTLPQFYVDRVRNDLGALWEHLPKESLLHDPLAYLKAQSGNGSGAPIPLVAAAGGGS
jgi:hypothetical protein